ncbi:hypothetical protein OIU34_24290 [Pararhizobium sp. BT-229]|uniref:hypothetical protein n=1 Tax=Pararhizobium sp. BT-229 TaxID=2986923 RepID=UPI0021F7CCCC|nr:hypothetical protein [Pararhizobium sp. BT-229]MCV9965020.1 hypothetical protein [Pararhizobium sp. BT-229]
MSDSKVQTTEVVETSFGLLRPKEGSGRSWRDRESLFRGLWAIAPMSQRAAEVVLETVADATATLKPGTAVTVSGFRYTLSANSNDGYASVSIEDVQGSGAWSLERSAHIGRHYFTVRQRNRDLSRILVSGVLVPTRNSRPNRVLSVNHDPADFRDLTRLATALWAGRVRRDRSGLLSDPVAPVLALDGGVPGEHARRLHRMLYEDATRRAMEWAAPLFERLTKLYAQEGFWWGAEAAQWSMLAESRFPDFRNPTTLSCLLQHPDRNSVAMLFRDAQPNIETETYIVWREAGGRVCITPAEEGSMDDIVEFLRSGGVPALTFDPQTGDVRATERAMSSKVLQAFCEHVGEAWTVLADLPLYADHDQRPMATSDFSGFSMVAPWTARGRRIAAESVDAFVERQKKNPAP